VFLPQSEGPSFAPIQHNWQNYSFIYFISLGSLILDVKTKDFGLNNSKHSLNLIYSYLGQWSYYMPRTKPVPITIHVWNDALPHCNILFLISQQHAPWSQSVKVKQSCICVLFNRTPRHEGVLGSGCIAPRILWPQH
jgi:hypothetical protein